MWHVPNGPEATAALAQAFFQLTDYPVEDRAKVPSEELDVGGGRTLHVPKSLKGVAVFSFKRLCGEAARRRRLSRHRPALSHRDHRRHSGDGPGAAQRGGALRDADRRALRAPVKLLAAADAEPEGLYPPGDGSFEFQRTVSRLEEMQQRRISGRGPRHRSLTARGAEA